MVSVREFCARYDVSHQAVYKKLQKIKISLRDTYIKRAVLCLTIMRKIF